MSDSITLKLKSGPSSIMKIGFLFRVGFFLTFVIGSALWGIHFLNETVLGAAICFIISFVFFLVIYKILSAAFFKEYVIVTKQDLIIIKRSFSGNENHSFNLNEIRYFGFSLTQYTNHPLHNPIVDITGLATQEREMQYVIDEGSIRIETNSKILQFGKNLASWEVEELMEKIEEFTGQKFTTPPQEIVQVDSQEDFQAEGIETDRGISPVDVTRKMYNGTYGELIIEQKKELPDTDDKVFLNGKLAPTGKYAIGEKQQVFVSNGYIYAVRGFGE